MAKRHEHTEKKGYDFLGTEHHETKVWDDEGNRGKGIDRDKGKSIEKAYKDYRERKK